MRRELFDVVVIGGGVTGAGVALDAATRGLHVALVEQGDYGSGTSSRSSRLFHGGLRYLQQLRFGLVHESLSERNLMLTTLTPHLARPVSFVYPLRHWWERVYVGAGLILYEILASGSGNPLPRHRHLNREELAELAPALGPEVALSALRFWDAVVDDARHTLTLTRTAAAHGALLASRTRAVGVGLRPGPVRTVTVRDQETGTEIDLAARSVVNATGVWSPELQRLAGSDPLPLSPSKGVHLVVPADRISSRTGILLRTEVSVLLVIPFRGRWLIGTTDTPWSPGRGDPEASRSDVDYLLRWANTVLRPPLTHEDVIGVFAGVRPLLAGESEDTSRLSRDHAVLDGGDGMVTVTGGKYTTYRLMARDAVDALFPYLPGPIPVSRTRRVPLLGSIGVDLVEQPRHLDAEQWDHLLGRYGSLTSELTTLLGERPELSARVVEDAPYLRGEIVYATTHEGALHLDDVLERRTRISLETRHGGLEAADQVSRLMGDELGWPEDTRRREIERYRSLVTVL